MRSIEFFNNKNYVVVKNYLSADICRLFYNYIKIKAQAVDFKMIYSPEKYDLEWDGTFNKDPQAPGDFSCYADTLMETLLAQTTPIINETTGLDVYPQYSYFRLYQKDTELVKHKDRPECEISTTLCLGWDISNLDYEYVWPFYINDEKINLNPGDMVIYKGCDVEHHREPFLGLNHAQVFLHYHDKKGPYYNGMYDNRPLLGVSKKTFFPKFEVKAIC